MAGRLDAPFMSIYIPADVDAAGQAVERAEALIDLVENIAAGAPGKFAVATCTEDIGSIRASDRIALPMGMENGGPIAAPRRLSENSKITISLQFAKHASAPPSAFTTLASLATFIHE